MPARTRLRWRVAPRACRGRARPGGRRHVDALAAAHRRGVAPDPRRHAARRDRCGTLAAVCRPLLAGRPAGRPVRAQPGHPRHPPAADRAPRRRRPGVQPGWRRLAGCLECAGASVILATAVVAAATPAYPAAAAGMPALSGDENDRWTQALVTVEVGSFVVGPALGGALVGRLSVAAVFGVATLSTVAGTRPPADRPDAPPGAAAPRQVTQVPQVPQVQPVPKVHPARPIPRVHPARRPSARRCPRRPGAPSR